MYKSQIKSQWSVSKYETKTLWRVGWRKGLPTSTHGASNKNWLASQLQKKKLIQWSWQLQLDKKIMYLPPPPPKKKKKSSWWHYFRTTRLNEVIKSWCTEFPMLTYWQKLQNNTNLIIYRNKRMMRRECPGRSFSMYKKSLLNAI